MVNPRRRFLVRKMTVGAIFLDGVRSRLNGWAWITLRCRRGYYAATLHLSTLGGDGAGQCVTIRWAQYRNVYEG